MKEDKELVMHVLSECIKNHENDSLAATSAAMAKRHIERSQSRLESLEKDAARYRWLSAQHWVEPEAVFRLGLSDTEDFGEYQRELDSAIDTAMQAQGNTND